MVKQIKLNPPSLQHMARVWRDKPSLVTNTLVRTVRNPPIFSYNPLFTAIHDMLILGVPYDDVLAYIKRKEKRPQVAKALLEILPLIRTYVEGVKPNFFQEISPREYPVAQDIKIPFKPPLIYGVGGQLYFPWFSFWRSNALAGKRLSFFVTLVDEILMQDPDLDEATFQILDFSIPKGQTKRELVVTDARDIPRLSQKERDEMLVIFAEGFRKARDEITGFKKSQNREDNYLEYYQSEGQFELFDNN